MDKVTLGFCRIKKVWSLKNPGAILGMEIIVVQENSALPPYLRHIGTMTTPCPNVTASLNRSLHYFAIDDEHPFGELRTRVATTSVGGVEFIMAFLT
jgi:hypothetical protein